MRKIILFLFVSVFFVALVNGQQVSTKKKILVLVEGEYNLKSYATAEGRQMADLLGHFNTDVTIQGVNKYVAKGLAKFDYVFYIGYTAGNIVPDAFARDVLSSRIPVIWINTGFIGFSKKYNTQEQYGFSVNQIDYTSGYNNVKAGRKIFTKGVPDINVVQVTKKNIVEILATAVSSKNRKEIPYMVRSGKLIYFADSPFQTATETDRYLFFADILHDILNESHKTNHQAIIRIEDVTPLDKPDKIRDIADILSSRGIPFLIGVVPFYVNPGEDRRVSLSEKPEMVDALKYAVQNGATIVMHGVTHQYKGVSTEDFEFWDGMAKKVIEDETEDEISRKLEMGIDECMRNGIYPMLWETPHYTASFLTYKTVAKYFSSAIEQRLSIEDADYSQYFPYIIKKDLFGQTIYPENLGYVPLNPNKDSSEVVVRRMIESAKTVLNVRDGFASCFFHSFLNLDLLKDLVDGISGLGFTFIDIRQQPSWVKTKDKVILTGTQQFKLKLNNSYLYEGYYNYEGDLKKKEISKERITGELFKFVQLKPGEFYVAEPIDYRVKELTFTEKLMQNLKNIYNNFSPPNENNREEARVSVMWNQYARGAAYNDQSSLVAAFQSVNINVDTIFLGDKINLKNTNLLVVPYTVTDSLTSYQKNKIVTFVEKGGNLITDRKNKLIEKFGIKFAETEHKIQALQDKFYTQEHIVMKYSQLGSYFDYDDKDEVLCEDASNGTAVVIGKKYGSGKLIYFNIPFDSNSKLGYSNFPYMLEYVQNYFGLNPVFKRENLEFYFDPGYRQNSSTENLVKMWVRQGIHVIHVAGWHQYPKYTYDYARLIKIAHANGILVYAWLEPPQVNQKFWNQHPEWREKNYKGEDVRPSWRYPVALTDEDCFQAMLKEFSKFLQSYEFDGVNVGELYFESGKGFSNPNMFTPMHPSARKEISKKYKIDLSQIFNPQSEFFWEKNKYVRESVTQYRIDKVTEFNERLVQEIMKIANKKSGYQVIVTIMDSYGAPELKEELGMDASRIIELQKKYGFYLQIEDPASKWSLEPNRYQQIGELYVKKGIDRPKLLLDLNILHFRTKEEVTPFPTLIQTGIESYNLINSSALGAPAFTIYSESSTNPQDLSLFSYASASDVDYKYTENGYEVNSATSFEIKLPKKISIISIDDQNLIGSRDNIFLIPAGKHIINFHREGVTDFSTAKLQPQILSFTGNILSVNYGMRQVEFTYESNIRALVSLTREPSSVKVDNQDFKFELLKGNDCYSLFIPSGKHEIEIITGNEFNYGVNLTSLWYSNAIVVFGCIAIALMVLMYFGLKIYRRTIEN